MNSMYDVLIEHKQTIGTIASIFTIAQFLSGIFVCKQIRDRKSTRGTSSLPFVGAVIIAVLVLKYSSIIQDDVMMNVNIGIIFLNSIYTIFYLCYSEDPWEEVLKPASYGVALIAIIFGYSEWESEDYIEDRYGILITILQLLLLASPLKEIRSIVTNKDASSIPCPLILMACIVSFLWFIYAIILENIFMLVQNFVGFMVCMVQLGLVYHYNYRARRITLISDSIPEEN